MPINEHQHISRDQHVFLDQQQTCLAVGGCEILSQPVQHQALHTTRDWPRYLTFASRSACPGVVAALGALCNRRETTPHAAAPTTGLDPTWPSLFLLCLLCLILVGSLGVAGAGGACLGLGCRFLVGLLPLSLRVCVCVCACVRA
jgi:hypothetical protein